MHKQKVVLVILGFILVLLSGCTSVPPAQKTTTPQSTSTPQAVRLVKPAGSIPITCTPTPVYFGRNDDGLAIPWIAATPSRSGIIGHLFFTQVTPANKPEYYEPMHTNGKMPDGATTKILWKFQNAALGGELVVKGKNLSLPNSTFQQTFPLTDNAFPSIVDVLTAGCWHFDLQSGSDQGIAIFWVLP